MSIPVGCVPADGRAYLGADYPELNSLMNQHLEQEWLTACEKADAEELARVRETSAAVVFGE